MTQIGGVALVSIIIDVVRSIGLEWCLTSCWRLPSLLRLQGPSRRCSTPSVKYAIVGVVMVTRLQCRSGLGIQWKS